MFENLSDRLQGIVKKLKGQTRITEKELNECLREVKLALLEADVNYKVVKKFVNNVKEKKTTATLYDTSKLKGKDKYALFLGGNYPILDIKTTADSTDRLLIIKDSYANSLIPFLIPYYREIVVVDPRYYYDDIEKVMKKDNITSVLFLYNGNTFVKDNSISGVLQND